MESEYEMILWLFIFIINQQLNMYAVRYWKNNKTLIFYAKLYFCRDTLIACDSSESPLVNGGWHSKLHAIFIRPLHQIFFTCGLITVTGIRQHLWACNEFYISVSRSRYDIDIHLAFPALLEGDDPDSKAHGANMGAYLGLTGPRWAPCWPHELCYQGKWSPEDYS